MMLINVAYVLRQRKQKKIQDSVSWSPSDSFKKIYILAVDLLSLQDATEFFLILNSSENHWGRW